jgi:hypothetical protein
MKLCIFLGFLSEGGELVNILLYTIGVEVASCTKSFSPR